MIKNDANQIAPDDALLAIIRAAAQCILDTAHSSSDENTDIISECTSIIDILNFSIQNAESDEMLAAISNCNSDASKIIDSIDRPCIHDYYSDIDFDQFPFLTPQSDCPNSDI